MAAPPVGFGPTVREALPAGGAGAVGDGELGDAAFHAVDPVVPEGSVVALEVAQDEPYPRSKSLDEPGEERELLHRRPHRVLTRPGLDAPEHERDVVPPLDGAVAPLKWDDGVKRGVERAWDPPETFEAPLRVRVPHAVDVERRVVPDEFGSRGGRGYRCRRRRARGRSNRPRRSSYPRRRQSVRFRPCGSRTPRHSRRQEGSTATAPSCPAPPRPRERPARWPALLAQGPAPPTPPRPERSTGRGRGGAWSGGLCFLRCTAEPAPAPTRSPQPPHARAGRPPQSKPPRPQMRAGR